MILEIKDLTVEFLTAGRDPRPFAAVDHLNLSVPEGSFTAWVGESGSGKSVTALSLCKLIKTYRTSGQILFSTKEGVVHDLLSCSESELLKIRGKEISYIFQDPASSLNPLMKVSEQLEEACLAHFQVSSEEAARRSLSALNDVKIKDVERVYRSYPHELSGGMKQRVMIAMALITEPRLLVADEPTTALDVMTEFEIMRLLVNLKKEKSLTVIFITHNLPLAMIHADSIGVMRKGRLIEMMKKEGGCFAPKEIYSKRLFSAGSFGVQPKTLIEI